MNGLLGESVEDQRSFNRPEIIRKIFPGGILNRTRQRKALSGPSSLAGNRVHRRLDSRGLFRGRMIERLDLQDRKSTRLNSSHQIISYAVFCLKKKKKCNSHGELHI